MEKRFLGTFSPISSRWPVSVESVKYLSSFVYLAASDEAADIETLVDDFVTFYGAGEVVHVCVCVCADAITCAM